MLPIFTVSLLWTLFLVLERRRTRAVLLVPVLLCLTFQLNFSALALVVPAAVALAYRAREVTWRWFAAGVGLAVVLLSPWLVHEARVGFHDVNLLFTEGRGGSGSSTPGAGTLDGDPPDDPHLGNPQLGLPGRDEQAAARRATPERPGRSAASPASLAAALLAAGLVTCAIRVVRGTKRVAGWPWVELDADAARRALLLAWLGGIWLSYVTSATGRVYPHYLIATYPVTFAVQGLALSDLAPRTPAPRRRGRRGGRRRDVRRVHRLVPQLPRARKAAPPATTGSSTATSTTSPSCCARPSSGPTASRWSTT